MTQRTDITTVEYDLAIADGGYFLVIIPKVPHGSKNHEEL